MSGQQLGFSGNIAKQFLHTEITPLLALVGLLLGALAVIVTPREEEPQINVTFANVFIPFPGATATEVEHLVSTPAEQVLSEISGIKHIYSTSRPGMSILTVEYKVGENRTDAIVRLYNKLFSNQDWLPQNLGVGSPIIKPKGIDDVPIITATLWSENAEHGTQKLLQVAHALESEIKRVKGTRDVYTVGGQNRVVHVLLDLEKMAHYGVTVAKLRQSLQASNTSTEAGALVNNNQEISVQAGTFLTSPEQVKRLVIGVFHDTPVFLEDVATIELEPDQNMTYSWFSTGPAAEQKGINIQGDFPSVTLAIAKKPGTNAVGIANQVIERFDQLEGIFIPEGVNITITRNYGLTADIKAKKLIHKLMFATVSVILLVMVTMGIREALVVGLAVIITLAITLFASWMYGFTLNRVSLFALIFSIGILVDDAIVVVENIHRHIQIGGKSLAEAIPLAVDEVGGPTILATFTVIAALLPMAFVTGLMGPYMSPIPINASMGMLISLAVAFIVTPWLTYKALKNAKHHDAQDESEVENSRIYRFFKRVFVPLLSGSTGKVMRWALFAIIILFIAGSGLLVSSQQVVLKMLPFDNKSEFQIVVDMNEGTPLEQTALVLSKVGEYLSTVSEVTDYQTYVGDAAPINFNGLVRQYYLREGSNVGDIQVNLVDKKHRDKKSHEVASDVRKDIAAIAKQYQANIKVVEVPPGPPVLSPLVGEIYGLDYEGQIDAAKHVRQVFSKTPDIIDIDDSVEYPASRYILKVDREKAALLGVSQANVNQAVNTILAGEDVGYIHSKTLKYPVPIRLELPANAKSDLATLLNLEVQSNRGVLVPIRSFINVVNSKLENAIHHKDLLPVVYVLGDMGGELDSPLYGMFEMKEGLAKNENTQHIKQYLVAQPNNPYQYSMKWDGEWQVTYETFRDMGIAYAIGMLLIYLLVVAQFKSYLVPLIIMAPIPLTIIGVLPGHFVMDAKFTATSMIGMIALAGIIVRNSILLVDFINGEVRQGRDLESAIILSGAVRAKPIILTGLAAMLGAFFIIDDPIFSGLAVSLIFGLFVSTVLTLIVIPVMYYAFMVKRPEFFQR